MLATALDFMSDNFGENRVTEYMPGGVREHIPVICVGLGELYYTIADKEPSAFSAWLIIAAKLRHFTLICLKLLHYCLLAPYHQLRFG